MTPVSAGSFPVVKLRGQDSRLYLPIKIRVWLCLEIYGSASFPESDLRVCCPISRADLCFAERQAVHNIMLC